MIDLGCRIVYVLCHVVRIDCTTIMARTRDLAVAIVFVLYMFQPSEALSSNHKEAGEAKVVVDFLSRKLHGNLLSLVDTYDKTKDDINQTIQDLVIVKKVQDLLSQLNNVHVPSTMCEHTYLLLGFRYKVF